MHQVRVQSLHLPLLATDSTMAISEDDGNGYATTEKAIEDGPLERR